METQTKKIIHKQKRALVCGGGGFIGGHLIKRLKAEGYWVRGVDVNLPEFENSPSQSADEFLILDLRDRENCRKALLGGGGSGGRFDEIYQLAANMGGMGHLTSAECEIMRDSNLINNNMIDMAIRIYKVPKYFFSSSVCIYRDMKHGEPEMLEEQAWPAMPDNEYGLEKLYAERMALAYGRKFGTKVRIARFQNTFGSFGTWTGGKEKAPAAICRKIAEAKLTGKNAIEVWGDGTAVRSYTYIEDLLDGIRLLMKSDIENSPQIANIGCPQYVSVNELVETVSRVAGYPVNIKHIKGPVGVESRNFSNSKIESLGWKSQYNLENGIKLTYPWIEQQVKLAMENEKAKQAADPWKETEETKTNEEDIKHQLNTTEQKQAEQAKQT